MGMAFGFTRVRPAAEEPRFLTHGTQTDPSYRRRSRESRHGGKHRCKLRDHMGAGSEDWQSSATTFIQIAWRQLIVTRAMASVLVSD